MWFLEAASVVVLVEVDSVVGVAVVVVVVAVAADVVVGPHTWLGVAGAGQRMDCVVWWVAVVVG